MIGIIGGSGLYEIEGVIIKEEKEITTPYGNPSDAYRIGTFSGRDVAFLPRHGSQHSIPPHKINYRANIRGFKELGVERIISFGATGGIGPGMVPGAIVILDQVIDMTNGRNSTFYDVGDGVVHIDFTEPYCPELRTALIEAGKNSGTDLRESGTYICVNGPRLETKAEIRFFSQAGADVVGMTAMPEASLAREAEICYGGVAIMTNYAAGLMQQKLNTKEVMEVMNRSAGQIKNLLREALTLIPAQRKCTCKEALKEAKV